jgi:hypothetical protein
MARGRKVKKGDTRSFGDFKKAQNERRLDRIYSQGKKDYASQNRGQSGGSSSIPSQGKKDAFVNLQRQKFFGGRDVPEERIFRRTAQDTNLDLFKKQFTKPVNIVDPNTGEVTGTVSGLSQATDDAPRSLTEERQRLADLYGPTGKEVLGDIGYGLGQLGKAYGIPFVSNATRLLGAAKSGVEQLWDKVRGVPTTVQGTAFPTPRSDVRDLFSSINTGIAGSDPNNLLVQIAMANQDRFDDTPTFEEQLANSTAQNFNIPDPRKIGETITDYITAAQQGVDIDTPIGNINVNPLANRVFLDGGVGPINYGGSIDPDTLDYNVGIGTGLPFGVGLSAGVESGDIPGVSLNKRIGPLDANLALSEQGGSFGLNTTVDPLRLLFPGSAIGTPINVGASFDSSGRVTPNIGFALPFKKGGPANKNDGLGFMLK